MFQTLVPSTECSSQLAKTSRENEPWNAPVTVLVYLVNAAYLNSVLLYVQCFFFQILVAHRTILANR